MNKLLNYGVDYPFSIPIYYSNIGDVSTILEYAKTQCKFDDYDYPGNSGNYIDTSKNILSMFPNIKKMVLNHVINYIENVMCRIIPEKSKVFISDSWILKCVSDNISSFHMHSFSWLSGVLYLNGSNCFEEGCIKFDDPNAALKCIFNLDIKNKEYPHTCQSWHFAPEAGKLLLFPSWINHKVESNKKIYDRYSLAFNVWIKGDVSKNRTAKLKY